MASWADEAESSIELASAAVGHLQKIDPTHELLWWWITPPEGTPDPFESENDRLTKMKDKFWQKPEPWQGQAGAIVTTVVTSNYFFAVKEEVQRLTGKEWSPYLKLE